MNLFRKNPNQPPKAGKLISVESFNIDERQIHASLLAQTLTQNDFVVEHIELQPPIIEYSNISSRAAALFYAMEHFKYADRIRSALTQHDVVIVEGYELTNAGFCGAHFTETHERIEFFKWIDNISFSVLNIPRPQLSIVLNPEEAGEELAPLKQSFAELSRLLPNTKAIAYTKTDESERDIHNKIWELVRRIALQTNLVKTKWSFLALLRLLKTMSLASRTIYHGIFLRT